ncbi:Protein of unknown function [Gryllus bimaculatus]|nr:Protein of unknown function [Gryllus bimaculatus]
MDTRGLGGEKGDVKETVGATSSDQQGEE